MSDGDALLAAIIREPDEDTPRLLYADWLDEQADDGSGTKAHRAKMIRGQLDPTGPQRWRTTFPAVADWVHSDNRMSLWIDGCCHHRADSQQSQDDTAPAIFIRRGFVSEITCTAADWLAHAETIRAAHPVTRVDFTAPRMRPRVDVVIPTPERTDVRFVCSSDGTYRCPRWPGVIFTFPSPDPA